MGKCWTSLRLQDGHLTDCLASWNSGQWSEGEGQLTGVEDIFAYALWYDNPDTEDFSVHPVMEDYLFLKLRDPSKLPPLAAITGAREWVCTPGSDEVYLYTDKEIDSYRKNLDKFVSKTVKSIKMGERYMIASGLYSSFECVPTSVDGMLVRVRVMLHSRTAVVDVPFWDLQGVS